MDGGELRRVQTFSLARASDHVVKEIRVEPERPLYLLLCDLDQT